MRRSVLTTLVRGRASSVPRIAHARQTSWHPQIHIPLARPTRWMSPRCRSARALSRTLAHSPAQFDEKIPSAHISRARSNSPSPPPPPPPPPEGAVTALETTSSTGWTNIPAVAVSPVGTTLWVVDNTYANSQSRGPQIWAVDPAAPGSLTSLAGGGASGCVDSPSGGAATFGSVVAVASDANGNLYVADSQCNAIRVVSTTTGATSTLASGSGASFYAASLSAIAVNAATGVVYVADANQIKRIIPLQGVNTLTNTGLSGISGPVLGSTLPGLALLQSGTVDQALFISDYSNNCIHLFNLSTLEISTFAGACGSSNPMYTTDGPALSGNRFCALNAGLALDSQNNLYVPGAPIHPISVRGKHVPAPSCPSRRVCRWLLPAAGFERDGHATCGKRDAPSGWLPVGPFRASAFGYSMPSRPRREQRAFHCLRSR